MNCKAVGQFLNAYLDGEVTPEDSLGIEAHLAICSHCRKQMQELTATRAKFRHVLRTVADEVAPSPQAWLELSQRLDIRTNPIKTTLQAVLSRLTTVQTILKRKPVIIIAMVAIAVIGFSMIYLLSPQPTVLSLEVNSPASNAALSSNLVKVTGKVSDLRAEVEVNGVEAVVDNEGSFVTVVELQEGSNTIATVATVDTAKATQTVTVDFTPPLAIFLDRPTPEQGVDYGIAPITATGRVSDPAATVTVNGFQAVVAADGEFSTQVQLKRGQGGLTATASLGNQTDSMAVGFSMLADGTLMPHPGINILVADYESVIQLVAGNTYTQEMVLNISKNTREPAAFNYQLTAVVNVNNKHTPVPWPEGLEVSITPASFLAYPNVVYSSLMVVKAAPELPSGEYLFQIESQLSERGGARQIIKVVVLPPGGAIEKTVTVNQSQTVNGITFTFERVELSDAGMKVYAFNTPPDYSLPQGPELAPPQFMALHASASYTVDGGTANSVGISGIQFLDNGMRHVWNIDLPVAKGSKELEFTISNLGDWQGPWIFTVPLE